MQEWKQQFTFFNCSGHSPLFFYSMTQVTIKRRQSLCELSIKQNNAAHFCQSSTAGNKEVLDY